MKRLYTILSLFLCTLSVYAQNNVFVLVDVSKSVKKTDLVSAKQALSEVFIGTPPSNSTIVGGSLQDLQQFKIATNDKIAVLKFGDQATTLNISPSPVTIVSTPTDIYQALNNFPTTPTDNNTYYTLAKAKIAEYAVKNNISKYVLCIVSDENEDDFGPGGKPNYQSSYIQELVDNYDTKANPATSKPAILVKINTSKQDFKLRFIPSIDVSKYTLPGGVTPAIVDTPDVTAGIKIVSPPKGKKGKEQEVNSETVNINWNCTNCPAGIKYTVTVAQYDDGKFREVKKDLVANTAAFKLPDGKFRVSVSASNYSNATSDTTYISVSTGSYGWIIFLLILIAAGAIGYYLWNKKRQQKIDVFASNKADDIFSKNSGGTTSTNSSNSDYF